MRILLVEDHRDSREIIKVMLESLEHEVIEASNGKEGLKLALKQNPELVLMDLSMPELDGFQTTSALRAFSVGQTVPIIAITVYPQSHWRDKAEEAGCDAYLQKPFTADQLADTLKQFAGAGEVQR